MNSSGLFGIDHDDLRGLILPYLRSLESRLGINPAPFRTAARTLLASERAVTEKQWERIMARVRAEDKAWR
jgi:hypothetical protein